MSCILSHWLAMSLYGYVWYDTRMCLLAMSLCGYVLYDTGMCLHASHDVHININLFGLCWWNMSRWLGMSLYGYVWYDTGMYILAMYIYGYVWYDTRMYILAMSIYGYVLYDTGMFVLVYVLFGLFWWCVSHCTECGVLPRRSTTIPFLANINCSEVLPIRLIRRYWKERPSWMKPLSHSEERDIWNKMCLKSPRTVVGFSHIIYTQYFL